MDPQKPNNQPVPPAQAPAPVAPVPTGQATPPETTPPAPLPEAPAAPSAQEPVGTTPVAPANVSEPPKPPSPSTKYIIAGLTIFAIIVLFAIGFLFYQNSKGTPTASPTPLPTVAPTLAPTPTPAASGLPVIPADWETYEVDKIKMTLKVPPNLQVIEDTQTSATSSKIYVQNYGFNSPAPTAAYQLYMLYEWEPAHTASELDELKKDLEPTTVQEVTIDGYKGIRGQIKSDKRYVTYFIRNTGLFSAFTTEATAENETTSNTILSTIDFSDN